MDSVSITISRYMKYLIVFFICSIVGGLIGVYYSDIRAGSFTMSTNEITITIIGAIICALLPLVFWKILWRAPLEVSIIDNLVVVTSFSFLSFHKSQKSFDNRDVHFVIEENRNFLGRRKISILIYFKGRKYCSLEAFFWPISTLEQLESVLYKSSNILVERKSL